MAGIARLINSNELDMLLELYTHLNPEDPDISGKTETRDLWLSIYNDPGQFIFVIEKDGCLVASCTLVTVSNLTRGGRSYGLIENVVTHSNYRKMGYSKAVFGNGSRGSKRKGLLQSYAADRKKR